jgi:hypothetical protein
MNVSGGTQLYYVHSLAVAASDTVAVAVVIAAYTSTYVCVDHNSALVLLFAMPSVCTVALCHATAVVYMYLCHHARAVRCCVLLVAMRNPYDILYPYAAVACKCHPRLPVTLRVGTER